MDWKANPIRTGAAILVVIVLIIIIGFVIFITVIHIEGEPSPAILLARCKSQIIAVPECINGEDGTWRLELKGLEFEKYGVSQGCANTLKGTSWYNDSTHFNCGEKPT